MKLIFYPRLFIYLLLGFIVATVVGTISHEAGHYLAGKYFGFPATMHYAAVSFGETDAGRLAKFDSLYKADKQKILTKESSPKKEYFLKYRDSLNYELKTELKKRKPFAKRNKEVHIKQHFITSLCGPLQTMLTGTIGFIALFTQRRKIAIKGLNFTNWLFVFLTFFWSRQVVNFIVWILTLLLSGRILYRGDEVHLSHFLTLPIWTIGLITAVIGTLILAWSFFRVIPMHQRFTFIIAGLAGSAAGWHLWMNVVGPAILP
jgi:hypothetical protein